MEPLLTFDSLKSRFNRPYYYANLFSCFIIPLLRVLNFSPFSNSLHYRFEIEWKATAVVVVLLIMKINRAASIEEGFGIFFLYVKLLNLVLLYFSSTSWVFSIPYVVLSIAIFVLLPQPPYCGPGEVIPLNKEALAVFLKTDSNSKISSKPPEVRILLLDTLWSTRCLNFQPVLASLSLKYTREMIKFGRIDLDEDPDYEDRFNVDASATSLQLPTVLLFVNGSEIQRLPNARNNAKNNSLSLWDRSEVII